MFSSSMCMSICLHEAYIRHRHVIPLVLELALSHSVGTGYHIWVLCRSRKDVNLQAKSPAPTHLTPA